VVPMICLSLGLTFCLFCWLEFHFTRLCDELVCIAGSGGEDLSVLLLHLKFIVDLVLYHH
jgi:hypothetical protein